MSQLRKQQRNIKIYGIQIDKPILIIEDSKPLAFLLSSLITKQWACDVHIAYSYSEAKEYLKRYRHEYHLAICDITLPDAPNGEIINLVKKAKVQMIAISGNYEADYVKSIINKGAIDFIDKGNKNAYPYATELVGRLFKNHLIKILVVDDSDSAAGVVALMLEKQNFQVLVAENGKKALEVLEENKDIRIILTDYNMPEMDGVELTVKIRQIYSKEQLAIIGLSGMNDDLLSSNFIKNGANDFLIKPFTYNELLCRVNQNMDMLEHMEHINSLANHDYMTKVFNRRYFFTQGNEIYLSSKESQKRLTICMMDIDHFKQVNDNYGHDCGDVVLIHFAKVLNDFFDDYLVARLGGEEFAVLFDDIDYQESLVLLDSFRQKIEEAPIVYEDVTLSITVSIGVTNQHSDTIDAMLKLSDDNLYQAKEMGRNKVIG